MFLFLETGFAAASGWCGSYSFLLSFSVLLTKTQETSSLIYRLYRTEIVRYCTTMISLCQNKSTGLEVSKPVDLCRVLTKKMHMSHSYLLSIAKFTFLLINNEISGLKIIKENDMIKKKVSGKMRGTDNRISER